MKTGLKKLFRDREICEAICAWFAISMIAACSSCLLFALWKKASTSSWHAVFSDIGSALRSMRWNESLFVGLGTGLSMLLWFLYITVRNRKLPQRYLSCLLEAPNRKNALGGLLICVIVTCLSASSYWLMQYADASGHGVLYYLAESPGGVFAILTGFATVVGTYVAVQSILELKHTITSYPQLIDRLVYLITEVRESKKGMMFLAYSPLTGAWNIDDSQRGQLMEAIAHCRTRVQMICLNAEDHLQLLIAIAEHGTLEKGPIGPGDIAQFQNECSGVIQRLADKATKKDGCATPLPDAGEFVTKAVQLPRSVMPGYYFFVSEERAIVVAPFGFPVSSEADANDSALKESPKLINVETLGFETTDRHIIHMLMKEFRKYATAADSSLAAWTKCTKEHVEERQRRLSYV